MESDSDAASETRSRTQSVLSIAAGSATVLGAAGGIGAIFGVAGLAGAALAAGAGAVATYWTQRAREREQKDRATAIQVFISESKASNNADLKLVAAAEEKLARLNLDGDDGIR
jgi:NAD/NADP transhydrogenase alpha subunit